MAPAPPVPKAQTRSGGSLIH